MDGNSAETGFINSFDKYYQRGNEYISVYKGKSCLKQDIICMLSLNKRLLNIMF